HDDDGDDPGEDRPVDEKARQRHSGTYGFTRWTGASWVGNGVTGMSGRIFCKPSTITRAPAFRPLSTCQSPPMARPVFNTFWRAMFFSSITRMVGSPFSLRLT